MCHWPSGKLAALDATGQAVEGYNNVIHENELLCDFTYAHVSPNVNESILLAVNPYHVVGPEHLLA